MPVSFVANDNAVNSPPGTCGPYWHTTSAPNDNRDVTFCKYWVTKIPTKKTDTFYQWYNRKLLILGRRTNSEFSLYFCLQIPLIWLLLKSILTWLKIRKGINVMIFIYKQGSWMTPLLWCMFSQHKLSKERIVLGECYTLCQLKPRILYILMCSFFRHISYMFYNNLIY